MSKEKEEMYDQLYEESYKERGIEITPEQAAEPVKNTEEEKAEKPADSGVTEKAEKPTGEEPAQVKGVEEIPQEEEKPKEETKTVPLASLHEEREKRKRIKAEYTVQLDRERREKQEILDTLYKYTQEHGEELLPEEKFTLLEDKVKELEETIRGVDSKTELAETQMEYGRVLRQVEDTDRELKAEGYPGFSKFRDLVVHEIGFLPEEERSKSNTDPSEWKRIYKEIVFPDVTSVFGGNFEDREFGRQSAEKNEHKKEMQMLGERKSESGKPKAESWTYDDYMQSRLKRRV